MTALHSAARRGRLEIVRLLLANRADINARTNQGRTALEIAADVGQRETVALLQDNGARGKIGLSRFFRRRYRPG